MPHSASIEQQPNRAAQQSNTATQPDGKFDFGIWGKNLNNNDAVTWPVSPEAFGVQFTTYRIRR